MEIPASNLRSMGAEFKTLGQMYYMQIRVLYAEFFLNLHVRYRGRPGNKPKVHVYYRVATRLGKYLCVVTTVTRQCKSLSQYF